MALAEQTFLEYGLAGALLLLCIDWIRRRIRSDRKRLAKYEKFARKEISKGDVGEDTLLLLDETDIEP